jgi:PPK2 family polyphosphate:nucleotide phosphotransferase
MPTSLRQTLGVPPGPVDLRAIDTTATPGAPGDKDETSAAHAAAADDLATLQEQLYAAAQVEDSPRRLLLVLQGMDTSGKDGAIKRGLAGMNPSWMHIKGFSAPTEEELRHDFLWRVRKEVPPPGVVGVFSRSHYEDVVAVRVRGIAPEEVWRPRFDAINAFEAELAADGVAIVKVFLHISPDYQRERQLRRLDRDDKRWKFDPGDLDDRDRWDDYMAAYGEAIERCNTPGAPWFVVPGDRKWYRNWAVAELVRETLGDLGLRWPLREDLDVDALRARLLDG